MTRLFRAWMNFVPLFPKLRTIELQVQVLAFDDT